MKLQQGKYGVNGSGDYISGKNEHFWICPNCETRNAENTCVLCGYQKEEQEHVVQKKRMMRISVIFACILSLILVVGGTCSALIDKDKDGIKIHEETQGAFSQEKTSANLAVNILQTDEMNAYSYGTAYALGSVFGNQNYQRGQITEIIFLDSKDGTPSDAWDVSQDNDGSVLAYVDENLRLFIAADGGTTAPKNCKQLFAGYMKATNIDFSGGFYTDNVEDMSYMFAGCKGLQMLDLAAFDTSTVLSMAGMFSKCSELEALDLSGFDTRSVNYMSDMFEGCTSLASLDLNNFDTGRVVGMGSMFSSCHNLSYLDISNFQTEQVTNMSYMFYECNRLDNLIIGDFNTSNVSSYSFFMPDGMCINEVPWEDIFS